MFTCNLIKQLEDIRTNGLYPFCWQSQLSKLDTCVKIPESLWANGFKYNVWRVLHSAVVFKTNLTANTETLAHCE